MKYKIALVIFVSFLLTTSCSTTATKLNSYSYTSEDKELQNYKYAWGCEFSGTVYNTYKLGSIPQQPENSDEFLLIPFYLIDIPLSLIFDTILLPADVVHFIAKPQYVKEKCNAVRNSYVSNNHEE